MKKEIKFKKGQKVKVIDRLHGHEFKIGEIVTIKSVNDFKYECVSAEDYWFLGNDELAPISPKKSPKKVTRVKKEKPQKELPYKIEVTHAENGYLAYLYYYKTPPFVRNHVFNTKVRLIKWIEKNI